MPDKSYERIENKLHKTVNRYGKMLQLDLDITGYEEVPDRGMLIVVMHPELTDKPTYVFLAGSDEARKRLMGIVRSFKD